MSSKPYHLPYSHARLPNAISGILTGPSPAFMVDPVAPIELRPGLLQLLGLWVVMDQIFLLNSCAHGLGSRGLPSGCRGVLVDAAAAAPPVPRPEEPTDYPPALMLLMMNRGCSY